MAEVNKCSLENILTAILAVGNSEQNQCYPASVFSSQYNTVTSLLLSKCADIYPNDTTVLDIIDPFVEIVIKRPENGKIKLPENFRNLLGTPQIGVKGEGKESTECGGNTTVTNNEFKTLTLEAGCRKVPLLMVDQAEFAYRTTSTYKKPTFDKPIGYRSGKNEITVCPYNINAVEIMYTKTENIVVYGYDMQPDDTFVYNVNKSVESQWKSSAFAPIFNAMLALYTAYSRDNQLKDWALYLNEKGLI